MDSSMLMIA